MSNTPGAQPATRQTIHLDGFSHKNPIPAACRKGPLLMSGLINGTDPATGQLAEGLEAQCAAMFQPVRNILADGGGTVDNLMRMTVWLKDPGYKPCANALLFENTTDAELETLHKTGVRGARFSFRQALGAVLPRPAFDRAVGKLRELGWYMKIQPEQSGIVESAQWFEHLYVPILIDHMDRADAALGPDRCPNITKLRQWLQRGNFWLMSHWVKKTRRPAARGMTCCRWRAH